VGAAPRVGVCHTFVPYLFYHGSIDLGSTKWPDPKVVLWRDTGPDSKANRRDGCGRDDGPSGGGPINSDGGGSRCLAGIDGVPRTIGFREWAQAIG
jgi:hypothetical protein